VFALLIDLAGAKPDFGISPNKDLPHMNVISFMSANFVARELGYHMTQGWGEGDTATNNYFRPLETFPERFGTMLDEIVQMGFDALDLWIAHLHPLWATPEHIRAARIQLDQRRLRVISVASHLGDTPEEVEKVCALVQSLGVELVGGDMPLIKTKREVVIALLRQYGVRLGIENHPEKTASELQARIGTSGETEVGACLDTGWFGTHSADASQALEALGPQLFHVHLKDVLAPGGHDTCRLGQGCVQIQHCVQTLRRIGYSGAISIEHEPHQGSPAEDVRASLSLLRQWLDQ